MTPLVDLDCCDDELLVLPVAAGEDCGSVPPPPPLPPEPAAFKDEFCTSPPAKAGAPLGKKAFQSCNRCVVKLTGMAPLEESLLDDAADCDSEKDSEDLVVVCCEGLVLRKLRILDSLVVLCAAVISDEFVSNEELGAGRFQETLSLVLLLNYYFSSTLSCSTSIVDDRYG